MYAPHREASGLLGSVSDLNGGFPWGRLDCLDPLIGTGFACGVGMGGIYVFNRGHWPHPLVPGAAGKLVWLPLGGLSITIDVGRYWNPPYFYIPVSLQRELGTV